MARPLRIEFPGAVYYISTSGNAGRNIFQDAKDGQMWLEVFESVCKRFSWICYSFCLMTDHYHLIIETPEPNLSKGMRQLNGVYTQNFNRRHNSAGHVFQGRFKSILVQKEKYLADLMKYVFFSPVRAGYSKYAHQFKWSNYKWFLKKDECPDWLSSKMLDNSVKDELEQLIEEISENKGIENNVLENVRKQIYLGDDEFISEIQKKIDREKKLSEIPKEQISNVHSINYFQNSSKSRDEAITKAYLVGNYTMKEIADYFSLHYSTVSRIIKENESEFA